MRTHIDYGIYFNDDFCQIARIENGVPTIKKTETLKESMSLCVHFGKGGRVIVGDAALNILRADQLRGRSSSNTFIGFVRTLGTSYVYNSEAAGKSFSSEELLAECFKQLKSFISDDPVPSAAITIPAKYLNPQIEATMRAARLAGFKAIELVSEPVAVAIAYGLGTNNKDGYWLIFDFGGGTFDAALVKAEEGILAVKDTDGDNWLGGKNLDEAIVDQIIIPNLQQNFSIESVLEDTDKKEILRNAVTFYAEEAIIQLSFKDSHYILSDVGTLPFQDDNGNEPEIDVLLTQNDLVNVVAPIFQRAIDITKELLMRNNLKGSDLGALMLVGGSTYSPILRRMLKEQITDEIDTSVDPMTVTAKGAALFASTISVSDELKETTRDRTKLQLDIKYEATTVELDEMVNLKLLKEKTTGTFSEKIYANVVRFDGAWSSGKKLIGEKATIIDVLLVAERSNSFEIHVYDEDGNKLECQPHQFTILQGIGGLDGMQVLPYHIGIAKFFKTEGKELFMTIKGLEKNQRLPATGIINGFKTQLPIRPGVISDSIRIPIYQGDYNAEGTNALFNNLIMEVIITGETVPALLPEGSEVDIIIQIDRSQLMKFIVYFPLLDHTEEMAIKINETEPPTSELLRREISKAMQTAKKLDAHQVSKNLQALEKELEYVWESADGRIKVLGNLREELLKLDNAERIAEWPKVEMELTLTFRELEAISLDYAQLEKFRHGIEIILLARDLGNAKAIIVEMKELLQLQDIPFNYIDSVKGELVMFYSDNPSMGKEKFRFLLGELIRIEKNDVSKDAKIKVIDSVKKEIIKWK